MGDREEFDDTQYPDNDEYVPYVTGGTLGQKNGAKVTLWGKVTKVTASEGFYVKTVDDHEVCIRLKAPLNEPLEGWYEIYGVVQGKNVICDEYVSLPEEMTKNIDTEGHKGLARLLIAIDDPWDIENKDMKNGMVIG